MRERTLADTAYGLPTKDSAVPTPLRKRRPHKAALFVVALMAAILTSWFILERAWHNTQLREAYLPQLETMERRDPYNGPLLALLAARLIESGEVKAAADMLRRAAAAGEQKESVWQVLAAAAASDGEQARAIADLRLGIKAIPSAPVLQASLGRCANLGPTPSPQVLAHAISPQGVEPLIADYDRGSFLNGLAEWWGRRHAEQSGFATRQTWAQEQPQNAQAQRLWGLALLRNRRLPEAMAVLTRTLTLAPNSAAVNLAMADALQQSGLPAKAALQYLHCLQLHPNWLPALLGLGRSSGEAGLKDNMLSSYRRATTVAPDSVEAWIGLGRAYGLTGSAYDKSVAAFKTAVRLAPQRTDFFDDYAASLSYVSRSADAETILRRRLAGAPDDAYGHFLLGTTLMNGNPTSARLDEAELQTREALRLSPHNAQADLQLAKIVLSQGKTGETIALLTDCLQRDPFNRRAMSLLARTYRQTGHSNLAEKASQQADALFRDEQYVAVLEDQERRSTLDPKIHQQLAILYTHIGQQAKAQHEQQMVNLLRTNPSEVARSQKAYQAALKAALGFQ